MPATPVYIICSPVPQVGKTLVARLLSEFILLREGRVAAFDINIREPSLLDYLPDITETADVIDTCGKMQLMDRVIVDDGLAKVIDLGFHAFDEFFKMTDEIGLLKEAAYRNVSPQFLFMAGSDRLSLRAHEILRRQTPRTNLVTVHNEHIVHDELPAAMGTGRQFRLAELSSFLKAFVDRPTFSFTAYLRQQNDSSAELHQWIRRSFLGFRELELTQILQGASVPP